MVARIRSLLEGYRQASKPDRYRKGMVKTTFTHCPKGHRHTILPFSANGITLSPTQSGENLTGGSMVIRIPTRVLAPIH